MYACSGEGSALLINSCHVHNDRFSCSILSIQDDCLQSKSNDTRLILVVVLGIMLVH